MAGSVSGEADWMRKIAILGYYGNRNSGDEAILASLLSGLRHKIPTAELTVLSSDPDFTTATHNVNSLPEILPATIWRHLICSVGPSRKRYRTALDLILQSELLIVGGGGLIFDRVESNRYLLEFLAKIDYLCRKNIHLALIGVGVGPLHFESSRRAVVRTLSQARLIVVRESASKSLLEDIGLSHENMFVAGDLGVLLEPIGEKRVHDLMNEIGLRRSESLTVAVCLRGEDARRPTLQTSLERLCRYLTTKYQASIWFLPFQFAGGDDDRPGLAKLKSTLSDQGNIKFVDKFLTPAEIHGLIGQTDFVVGERFHSLVFASANSKPFVGISYHAKVARLFQMMNREDLVVNLDDIDEGSLVDRFDRAWNDKTGTIADVIHLYKNMAKQAQLNFDLIADHFSVGVEQTAKMKI
jgi:polysaccharide pyruvyl transferase WcaK-like protein